MMGGASVETTGFNPCRKKESTSGHLSKPFKEQAVWKSGGSHSTWEGRKASLTLHYKAFNFLSLRFKVFKLSTKHPSPLYQSNLSSSPGHEEGREARGAKGERNKQQRPILEILLCPSYQTSKTFIICTNFGFKKELAVTFPSPGELTYQYGISNPRKDFRFFSDTQYKNISIWKKF